LFNSIFLQSFDPVLNVGHQQNTRLLLMQFTLGPMMTQKYNKRRT